MSEYRAGVRAARDRLAREVNRAEVANSILETQFFPDGDPFYQGYRAQLAWELNRWCKHCKRVFDEPNYWRTCPSCLSIEYPTGEGHTILDAARTSPMSDRWEMHTLVDSAGGEYLWLFDINLVDESCPGRTWPAHENLGPLPDEFRVRILRNRCGRMTRSGKPCRNGPWCKYHR